MRAVFGGGIGLISALAAVAPGCGGGGGGGGSLSLDQLGAEYAAVFCQKAFTCCDAAEIAMNNPPIPDEATCRATLGAQVSANTANTQASIDAGRVRYDGDRARRCLDSIAALPCAQWGTDEELRRFPDCLRFIDGTVAPGGTCGRDQECADGYCDTAAGGTCVAQSRLGESCSVGSCVRELACLYDTSGVATVCAAPLADGSPCSYDSECVNFCEARVCGPPTFCNGI